MKTEWRGVARAARVRAAATALAAAAMLAAGAAPAFAAGLLIADGGLGGVLEIKEHAAQVTINNGIAVTEVTQVFRNTESRQVEALYTFPVPKGASVANFSMWIDGKEMVGEVVEKKRAREIYDSYKRVRRDPGLLEQTDYKTFEMRIFPINAGAEQRVRITYYQELDYDDDWATWVYPLATVTRTGLDSRTTGKFSLTVHARSEVPIVSMESPSHGAEFVAARHGEGYWQGSMETKSGDLNRDVVVACRLSRPNTGIDIITSRQAGEDGYFCLTLTAGKELERRETGMDYVFILDVSGSMQHDGKLLLSRKSIAAYIETLGPDDRFEVITFNVAPSAQFNALRPAAAENKAATAAFLESQTPRGGTVLRPALAAAYKYSDPDRTLNVVILSDGMTEQGERASLVEQIRARPVNVRVFCVGVGNEVNRPLLEQLAEDAGGLASFLSPEDNFERQANAFRRKLTRPVAADVRIDFEGAQVYDVEPRKLPNLYHGSPVRMYGRYREAGPVNVVVRATVNNTEIKKTLKADLPRADGANPEIDRMWAWHKVERLLREAEAAASRDMFIQDIVRLGEGYSIATQYTSFIVLENDAEYKRWQIERRNALRIERDRKPQEALLARLEAMRMKAATKLGPDRAAPQVELSLPVVSDREMAAGPQAPAQAPQPQPRPKRQLDLDLFPRGGGPVGPVVGVVVAGLIALEWRRRRKEKSCNR